MMRAFGRPPSGTAIVKQPQPRKAAMPRLAFATLLILVSAGLTACTEAFGSRLDDRTFRIEGPQIPGGSDAPNRRLAEKLCPRGYRVLEQSRGKSDADAQIATNWTIRCL
jgi:hypothetical protein